MSQHATLSRLRRIALPLLLLTGTLLVTAGLFFHAQNQGLAHIRQNAEASLSRYIINLRHQLARHRDLPRLLATQQQLKALLADPYNPQKVDAANRYLAWVNRTMGATDSYLIDSNGITLAASNWDQPNPFIGNDYSFRPYFQQAVEGGQGRYFALGNTSRVRGYFFSAPVRQNGQIIGVAVVKVDLEDIEGSWNDALQDILVMDEDGVIFISTRHHWRFRLLPQGNALVPDQQLLARIQGSRRYENAEITPLPLHNREITARGNQLLTLNGNQAAGHYLLVSELVPEAGMRVAVLANLSPLKTRIARTLVMGLGGFWAIAALLLFLRARHRMQRRHERELQQAHEALERRVEQRTRQLTDSNQRLKQEVEQHRQTQDQLVQAAKMAVLGQLSAGINHELNQPLTAIRQFADNGRKLLERGRTESVAGNLREIGGLAERMAAILQPLREFARQRDAGGAQTRLAQLRQGVMVLMGGELEKRHARLHWPNTYDSLMVAGDLGRLEQVLVNLIGNALQAMADEPAPRIDIDVQASERQVTLRVRDDGPGLSEQALAHIFEPFFTTKSTGLGLGLSISHRIVQSLGGELTAANHPQGGAIFTLVLARAHKEPA
ncbi:sensor histidine kinase [Oceanimonas doudoroffii]|uniref:C4-dicarboxylate transport sensor protein DctB n=1 Tax=Oceanimonas doudoroffii TaxID=84158 RepID=A0A233RCD5_9GAMM|nr:ATP-binding protein [Oceanimonas doudoroffii]OXY81049.1 two-component sensor histidine kinase [Oceanimonas doudoroffii]